MLLALLNCSNSVLVRGVYIDAEEPAGQCVIFPVYYVRVFFQKERTKKRQRQLANAAMASAAAASSTLMPLLGGGEPDMIKNNLKVVIVPAGGSGSVGTAGDGTQDVINYVTETNGAGGGRNNNDDE